MEPHPDATTNTIETTETTEFENPGDDITGQQVEIEAYRPNFIRAISLNPDHSIFAAASTDYSIKLYDINNVDTAVVSVPAHTDIINEVKFSEDPDNSQFFLSCSEDGYIKVWDQRTPNKPIKAIHPNKTPKSIDFNGNMIVSGTEDHVVFYDVRTFKWLRGLSECHSDDITSVRFNKLNSQKVVTGGLDEMCCVIDLTENNEDDMYEMMYMIEQPVIAAGFCGLNSENVYALTTVNTLEILNIENAEQCGHYDVIRNLQLEAKYLIDAETIDNRLVMYVGDKDHNIIIHEAKGDSDFVKMGTSSLRHDDVVRCCRLVKDSTFVSCDENNQVKVWVHEANDPNRVVIEEKYFYDEVESMEFDLPTKPGKIKLLGNESKTSSTMDRKPY
mmetsp:Transcript_2801/g.2959  ORF Transcript_2801/g.2959 Transcript_2801/m.2959 type:complete len:388 (+) Transcript_2801:28-1191(+)